MASGKSLELKKFDEEHSEERRQKIVCTCGKVWAGPDHFTKDGKLREATAKNIDCVPTGRQGILIKAVAAKQAKRKIRIPGGKVVGFEDMKS
jgi:hypothetical protein